ELSDTQPASECQTVRGAAHLSGGCHHVNVADLLQGFLEFDKPVGLDTVVVCNQNPDHTNYLALAHSGASDSESLFKTTGEIRMRPVVKEYLSRGGWACDLSSFCVCAPALTSVSPSDRED